MMEASIHSTLNSPARTACPACASRALETVYVARDVPVHAVLLIRSREEARAFPRGDLRLAYCRSCGFLFNALFDETKLQYGGEYEETQGFSATFNAFHRRLAVDLIERYDLRHKRILEIGCGKGEFLALLCELGPNTGIGFDPAYVPDRMPAEARSRLTFVQDFYSEAHADVTADFVCCKMTLEHIPDVANFVGVVRKNLGDRRATVFFQVPDTLRLLEEAAFWDVYYEHCSYFTSSSLRSLFSRQGFDVRNLWTAYDGQYLMIEAEPALGFGSKVETGPTGRPERPALGRSSNEDLDEGVHSPDDDVVYGAHLLTRDSGNEAADALVDPDTESRVARFRENLVERMSTWRSTLRALHAGGKKTILWGGGSKAVAFLTTLGLREEIAGAVDVNPHRQGTFLAGSGHEILAPNRLIALRPDVVVVMNPIYLQEIGEALRELDLDPVLTDVTRGADELTAVLP